MPEVTPLISPRLPAGVDVCYTPIDAPSRTPRRREAEREAVARLIEWRFGRDVSLGHRDSGAPVLLPPSDVAVSISHSLTEAWLAVSRRGPVGIDAEHPRPQLQRVAPRFLSPREAASTPSLARLLLFWTAKEAVYKAAATPGLDMRHIEVDPEALTATLPDGRRFLLAPLAPGLTLAFV